MNKRLVFSKQLTNKVINLFGTLGLLSNRTDYKKQAVRTCSNINVCISHKRS